MMKRAHLAVLKPSRCVCARVCVRARARARSLYFVNVQYDKRRAFQYAENETSIDAVAAKQAAHAMCKRASERASAVC